LYSQLININAAMAWFKRLIASISTRRIGVGPMLVNVGYVVDKLTMVHDFL